MIGAAHPDAVAALGLEVGNGVDAQLIAQDVEGAVVGSAGASHQAVGEGIPRILVGATEAADQGACGDVFVEAGGAEGEIGGSLIQVVDGDGERLFKTATALIGCANANAVNAFGFEVGAGIDVQLVVRNAEGVVVRISRPCHETVKEAVADVEISSAEATYKAAGDNVFVDAAEAGSKVSWCVVDIKAK